MRITVDLPDELVARARERAAEEHTSLRQLVESGLRIVLAVPGAREPAALPRRVRWVVAKGGLPPGVDVSNRVSFMGRLGPRA